MHARLDTQEWVVRLQVACELELWQEAFRSVEDIQGLSAIGKKPPKPQLMALYYAKLTQIFTVSEAHLYNGCAAVVGQALASARCSVWPVRPLAIALAACSAAHDARLERAVARTAAALCCLERRGERAGERAGMHGTSCSTWPRATTRTWARPTCR